MRRLWLASLLIGLSLFAARPARAQHYDVSFNAGVSKRFLSNGQNADGPGGSFGPLIGVSADVALMPLIRLGAYVDEELAADGEPKAPWITSFGGRLKFLPPLGNEKLRAWLFVGFGYARLVAPAYHQNQLVDLTGETGTLADATVPSASGGFLEVPFGVGGSYQLRAPWVLLAELSGRADFGSSGSYFDGGTRNAYVTSSPENSLALGTGSESFAVILTVGIGLDL